MSNDATRAYQLKITLNGTKPPIWRRVIVAGDTDLFDLHDIIQIAMGWEDSHMHQFTLGEKRYGSPDPEWDSGVIDEEGVRIDSLLKREKDSFVYEYDFGDGWKHQVVLEKIILEWPEKDLPKCTAGRRACPLEDIGGVWGYANFLEVIGNPSHPEYEDMLQWAGDDFDPEAFDPDEVNAMLRGE